MLRAHLQSMKVGIIDVGSNTVRLLVARQGDDGELETVLAERAQLGLGAAIERSGIVSRPKRTATARRVARYAAAARDEGCDLIDLVITAPGRQSENAYQLVTELEFAAGLPARVLSVEEEGRLAYAGALRGVPIPSDGGVAVCDVGGGSTELAVGYGGVLPAWLRSYDVGSLRLTCRHLDGDPPSRREVRRARDYVRAVLAGDNPPEVALGLATGGAARALRRLVGRTLGADELAEALELTTRMSAAKLAKRGGIDPDRAKTRGRGCGDPRRSPSARRGADGSRPRRSAGGARRRVALPDAYSRGLM